MRRALPIATGVFLMVGCAPLSRAVIGPTATQTLAMWRGTDVREMDVRENGRLVPLTWTRVLGPGLDPAWALMELHEEADARPDVFVVADLHRVDDGVHFLALSPLVERAMSRHRLWVAAHHDETAEALDPLQAPEDQAPPTTVIDAIAWSTDRLVLTITTTFAVMGVASPCGETPERVFVRGGIAWSRTYDITQDGTVTPISDDVSRPLAMEEPPDCDDVL